MHFLNSSCAPCGRSPSAEPAHGQAPGFLFQFAVSLRESQRAEAQHCCHFCSPPFVWGGCRTRFAPGIRGERRGKCHPLSPAVTSCLPHLFPEEPSFPNFHGRQEQGNPVARAERPERGWGRQRGRGMEGSPAASPRVCSPPSCAVQGGMRLSQVTAGDLAVLPRGDPGLEQPQLSLGVQGSCRAAFLLSLSCVFLAMLLGREGVTLLFFHEESASAAAGCSGDCHDPLHALRTGRAAWVGTETSTGLTGAVAVHVPG